MLDLAETRQFWTGRYAPVNKVLRDILSTGKVQSVSGEEVDLAHAAAISSEEGELLSNLIQRLNPKVSVEIGLAYGVSALYICDALAKVKAKKHYIIDPNQSTEWKGIGISNLERAGHKALITFLEKPSHVALPELLRENVEVDFGFIDGWHVFDQVIVDFFFIDKMLRIGGLLAFDDASWPSIRKALRFVIKNRKYEAIACLQAPHSKRDRLARLLMPLSAQFSGQLLKPEIIEPDSFIGLVPGSRCVVLRKQGYDHRDTTDHYPF